MSAPPSGAPLPTEAIIRGEEHTRESPSAGQHSLSANDLRKQARSINTIEEFVTFFATDFDGFVVCLSVVGGMFLASLVLTRVLRPYRAKFPIVLAYLFVGVTVRLLQPALAAEELMIISKPMIRMALTAVGLIIGSHLNRVTLAPLLSPMARFVPIFSAVVIIVMSAVAAFLFPTLGQYAPLVGAISLERSSPEALAGIVSAKAEGLFTSTTMCTAAVQDVLALVFFVVFSSTVGTPVSTAVLHLIELGCGTALAMSVTVLTVRAVELGAVQRACARLIKAVASTFTSGNRPSGVPTRSPPAPSIVHHKRTSSSEVFAAQTPTISPTAKASSNATVTTQPAVDDADDAAAVVVSKFISSNKGAARASLVTVLIIIPLVGWFFHVELLLAAVLAGVILNYDSKHPLTPLLEESEVFINMVLFTFLGQRIRIGAYLDNVSGAAVFFTARTAALAVGSWLGGHLSRLPPHTPETTWMHKYRWMGLITQLAIALSLVDRMEEQFKDSVPMASAFGGSVLLALVTGPPALQYVLAKVGEAGAAKEGFDSHV